VREAVEQNAEYVKSETLSTTLECVESLGEGGGAGEFKVDEVAVKIAIEPSAGR
jgi:hypothetical protein